MTAVDVIHGAVSLVVESGVYRRLAVLFDKSVVEAVIVQQVNVLCDERVRHLSLVVTDEVSNVREIAVGESVFARAVKEYITVSVIDVAETVLLGVHHILRGFIPQLDHQHCHSRDKREDSEAYEVLGAFCTFHCISLRIGTGLFLSAFGGLRSGFCEAMSIPTMKPLVIMELPPVEMNGIVTPVKGIRLHEPKMLSAVCTVIAAQIQLTIVAWKYERGGLISGTARIISITSIIISA